MKISSKFFLLALLFSVSLFTACDDDEGGPDNTEELITTVQILLTPSSGSTVTYEIKDLDGPGGDAPTVATIDLQAGESYSFSVKFLDESDASDVEDITEEVMEEDLEHLACYGNTGSMPAVENTSNDSAGDPLGLTGSFTVDAAATGAGTLSVVLKHEPDKADADACSTGETDVEVTFGVTVQ